MTIIVLGCLVAIIIIIAVVSGNPGRRLKMIVSRDCISYRQPVFSNRLNDRIVDYSAAAKRNGAGVCNDESEINTKLSKGILVRVSSGRLFLVGDLSYSYPCLTREGEDLLEEIARRFRAKADASGLGGSRFIVTSLTRTSEQVRKLKRNNPNASVNSPHVNGNAFDISYIRFRSRKFFITDCDKRFLKEALAEVIVKLRDENRCWATYERNQNCFHVVAR